MVFIKVAVIPEVIRMSFEFFVVIAEFVSPGFPAI